MKVTLYIRAGADIRKWRKFVSSEIAEARNIKSKATRDSVFLSLRAIRNRLQAMRRIGGMGVAFFAEDGVVREEVPPQPFNFSTYHCGNEFQETLLDAVVDQSEGPYTGIIAIDAREASIGVARGEMVMALWHGFSSVIGKHRAGGQSSQRFQRGRDEQLKEWRRKVIRTANALWLDYEIAGVVVGGAGFEKKRVVGELKGYGLVTEVASSYCDDVYGLNEAWRTFNMAVQQ